jgi:16S rRNA (cytosine1402-N4)-methyltransferase
VTEGEGSRDGDEERGPVRVHEPVLLRETLEALALQPGSVVVDGTVGAGGHAADIARAIGPEGFLLGLDRDAEILARARATLRGVGERVRIRLQQRRFAELGDALAAEGLAACDRVLLDLGVSSVQLDDPQRGFSFMRDAPLDMRMDRQAGRTAAEWLQHAGEAELAAVLRDFGEERHARRIARSIVAARQRRALRRTGDLVDAVLAAVPARLRERRIHPATRTFQAIRIAVNDELGELERGLAAAAAVLRPGGRLVVISFHSLEDRIVKHFLRARMRVLTRKPVVPGAEELARNPRSRSAKLRCGEQRGAAA